MHLLAVVAACQTSMPRPNRGLELSAAGATISNRAQNGSTSELQTSQSEYIIQPATSVARWTALKTKSAKGAGGGAGWHAFLGVYDIRCIIYIYDQVLPFARKESREELVVVVGQKILK